MGAKCTEVQQCLTRLSVGYQAIDSIERERVQHSLLEHKRSDSHKLHSSQLKVQEKILADKLSAKFTKGDRLETERRI